MSRAYSDLDIVVSGIGLVTPLGNGREKTWSGLMGGQSGLQQNQGSLEGRVFDFSLNGARSRMGDFALLAAQEALEHAGIIPAECSGEIGCVISQSKPVISSWGTSSQKLNPELLMGNFFGWSANAVVKKELGIQGPSLDVSAACATGISSIMVAAQWIQSGQCETVLVGAAESSLNSFYKTGFDQLGVLTSDLSRPFDVDRDGFAIGEGAAVLVLERMQSVQKRRGPAWARLLSVQMLQHAQQSLAFDAGGQLVARLIERTMQGHPDPDYINVHGTGTRVNDRMELSGLRLAFSENAKDIPISSTKPSTGHLLGASGAIEAAFSVLSVRDQMIPPNLNLKNIDSPLPWDINTQTHRKHELHSSLSLSYGFGGQMGAVLFGEI